MTYKNFLIVASKKDMAGVNITTQLSQFGNPMNLMFRFYLVEEEIIFTESLDLEKINQFDFIIFASRHQSEKQQKSLSVHAPGNWGRADFGGSDRVVCKTSALFAKKLFETLQKNAEEHFLTKDYQVTLECTHHGPLINKPCVFIEIGSSELEWTDRKAGFVIAKTINEVVREFKPNPYNEIAIGVGGPHYCPGFNKLQLNSNYAISHIIPEYTLPLTEEMIKEAISKTEEDVDVILLDWKGLGNSEKRNKSIEVLKKLYIPFKKTSEVRK